MFEENPTARPTNKEDYFVTANMTERILVDTESSPYRLVNDNGNDNVGSNVGKGDDQGPIMMVKMPDLLESNLSAKEWNKFVTSFNKKLEPLEETIALLKVVTVVLVILYILTTSGIVLRYALLGPDNEDQLGRTLSIILFLVDLALFTFHLYFLVMIIGTKLHENNHELHQLCNEMTTKTTAVQVRYVHWGTLKVVWYDRIGAHVEIAAITENGETV